MSTREERIEIQVDGDRIAGTFVMPSTRLPGVLFIHGWGGSQHRYLARARESTALGCVCLTFDLRGHGDTQRQQETVSREANLHDVLAAYDALAHHPQADPASIAVIGSSYGGYLAAILTTMRPVKWLALRAPALYMDSGWQLPKRQLHKDQDLDSYRKSLVSAKDNKALSASAAFDGDVLIVESEFDTVVPHAVISNYMEAFIKPQSLTYRVISGADHGLTSEEHQQAFTMLLMEWLREMIFGARTGAVSTPASSPIAAADSGGAPESAPRTSR